MILDISYGKPGSTIFGCGVGCGRLAMWSNFEEFMCSGFLLIRYYKNQPSSIPVTKLLIPHLLASAKSLPKKC